MSTHNLSRIELVGRIQELETYRSRLVHALDEMAASADEGTISVDWGDGTCTVAESVMVARTRPDYPSFDDLSTPVRDCDMSDIDDMDTHLRAP